MNGFDGNNLGFDAWARNSLLRRESASEGEGSVPLPQFPSETAIHGEPPDVEDEKPPLFPELD